MSSRRKQRFFAFFDRVERFASAHHFCASVKKAYLLGGFCAIMVQNAEEWPHREPGEVAHDSAQNGSPHSRSFIMNTWQRLKKDPRIWERYFIREKVIKAIRRFLDDQAFHEVEAPILITHPPAESHLELFETTLLDRNRQGVPMYLSTSPEVPLKKLMVAGIGNCYAITKSFRNMETGGPLHNPEFTILEFYRVGADYRDIMTDTEMLVASIAKALNKDSLIIQYQGKSIDLTHPWERLSVAQAFEKYAHVDFDKFFG